MNTIVRYRVMTLADYDAAMALWQATEGIGLSGADEPDPIAAFLNRNAGLSQVAFARDRLVGAVLCGHDGRRGYIHHLAVAKKYRRSGIGRQLVERALDGLRAQGIQKCHLFVFGENEQAIGFWREIGWTSRPELNMMSIMVDDQ